MRLSIHHPPRSHPTIGEVCPNTAIKIRLNIFSLWLGVRESVDHPDSIRNLSELIHPLRRGRTWRRMIGRVGDRRATSVKPAR